MEDGPVATTLVFLGVLQDDLHVSARGSSLQMGSGPAQSERKDERRRRGDEKTQTSDARFDERFQLAHGLGARNQPWYAQQGSTLPSEADRCAAPRHGTPLLCISHHLGGPMHGIFLGAPGTVTRQHS